jgi:glyoxylase-like metal-dependent hydrolase (beta-lactamase superfamily II)
MPRPEPESGSGVVLPRRSVLKLGLACACSGAGLSTASQALQHRRSPSAVAAGALAGAPDAARPAGGKGYALSEIGGGVYWVSDGAYNTMFVVSSKGVIACDAPPTLGENYRRAIAEVTDKPVTHLLYSHEHVDHIAGARVFAPAPQIIANRRTAELLRQRGDPRRPVPDVVFDERYTLELGDQTLQLSYHGVNHSIDNTFIYAPRQRVLMLIDVIYPGWMPYKNLGVAVDVPGFVEAHRQALTFDFQSLVAGHVSRLGTRADVELQLAFLKDLYEAAQRAYATLPFPRFLAEHGQQKTSWESHNDYELALVDRVAVDVAPRWRDRLAGFDAYFHDNCWAMLETIVVQGSPRFP